MIPVFHWENLSDKLKAGVYFFFGNFRDIERIKAGIAEQVSHFLYLIISFAMLVILAFFYGWELTLIVLSYVPVLFAANIFIGRVRQFSFDSLFRIRINFVDSVTS